jgi:ribosome-associated protein
VGKDRERNPRGGPLPFALALGAAHVELQQLLKATGACDSGGEAKHAVKEGRARVNGEVETRRGRKLVPGDLVAFDGRVWRVIAPPSA